jgi:hypothetical protein
VGIDERLEKLAKRHDALTESIKMMRASRAEESEETDRRFIQLADLFVETDSFIRTLAKIAQRHEERLDELGGGE